MGRVIYFCEGGSDFFFTHYVPPIISCRLKKQAWGRTSGGADAGVIFLSDANAELSRALGLSIEGGILVRAKRFSLIADDGVVTHYFSSAKESSDTWAPNVLAAL